MTFERKCTLLGLLYSLQRELLEEAEKEQSDVDETLDEALRVLINYLD